VLAPSRPGYLRTPLQSGRTPEDQADLYEALLDALDIERTAILGFSSGAVSAVHFAARHPDRTTALLLDSPVCLPFESPLGALRRAIFESGSFVWLSYQIAMRKPELMTKLVIDGVSDGLTKDQRREEASWITSDPTRLRSLQEQFASVAPWRYRKRGWINDQLNELSLPPLPLADVTAPTLIAHGRNDAVVPLRHATAAAEEITGAELSVLPGGHHMLSLSRNYGPVAQRQLELAHG
jgi:pimeloyl-ACP methyl ester carboxylesterase